MTTSKSLSSTSTSVGAAQTIPGAVFSKAGVVISDTRSKGSPRSKGKALGELGTAKQKAAPPADISASKNTRPRAISETKADLVLKKLRLAKGATLDQLVEATGWQPHSVRGFLSGMVKKKLGLQLASDIGKDGMRRYRINDSNAVG